MSTEKGPKHIYAQGNELYDYYYQFGEHWEKELEKMTEQSEEQWFSYPFSYNVKL